MCRSREDRECAARTRDACLGAQGGEVGLDRCHGEDGVQNCARELWVFLCILKGKDHVLIQSIRLAIMENT